MIFGLPSVFVIVISGPTTLASDKFLLAELDSFLFFKTPAMFLLLRPSLHLDCFPPYFLGSFTSFNCLHLSFSRRPTQITLLNSNLEPSIPNFIFFTLLHFFIFQITQCLLTYYMTYLYTVRIVQISLLPHPHPKNEC